MLLLAQIEPHVNHISLSSQSSNLTSPSSALLESLRLLVPLASLTHHLVQSEKNTLLAALQETQNLLAPCVNLTLHPAPSVSNTLPREKIALLATLMLLTDLPVPNVSPMSPRDLLVP